MVAPQIIVTPNLSYVRVNTESLGTGKDIKSHITQNMSPSDPMVQNAGLFHKEFLEQPSQPPAPALWRLDRENWVELDSCYTVKTGNTPSPKVSNVSVIERKNKRRAEPEKSRIKKVRVELSPQTQTIISTLLNKISELEKQLKEKEGKLNLVSQVLMNQEKRKILIDRLNNSKTTGKQ